MTGRFAGREFRPTKDYLEKMLRAEQHKALEVRRENERLRASLAEAEKERDTVLEEKRRLTTTAMAWQAQQTVEQRQRADAAESRLAEAREALRGLLDAWPEDEDAVLMQKEKRALAAARRVLGATEGER